MDMSKLKAMKMPPSVKMTGKLDPTSGMSAGPAEGKGDSGGPVANPELAKFPEMDLLDELKSRGCVDDDQYSAIEESIQSKSGAEGSPEEEASESPEEESSEAPGQSY